MPKETLMGYEIITLTRGHLDFTQDEEGRYKKEYWGKLVGQALPVDSWYTLFSRDGLWSTTIPPHILLELEKEEETRVKELDAAKRWNEELSKSLESVIGNGKEQKSPSTQISLVELIGGTPTKITVVL